jgi:hypothetical protein
LEFIIDFGQSRVQKRLRTAQDYRLVAVQSHLIGPEFTVNKRIALQAQHASTLRDTQFDQAPNQIRKRPE